MGWTSYCAETKYKNGRRYIDRKAECDHIFNSDMVTWDDDHKKIGRYEVLKSAMVGSTYYAAIKQTKFATETEPELTRVFGMVCLTSVDMKEYFNFSYKDMDETMGPYKYDCPKGILDLLDPIDSEYANEWRKQCYENHAKKKNPSGFSKLPVGTIIKLAMPFDTTYFKTGQEVKLQKRTKFGSNRTAWFTMTPPTCRFVPSLMKLLEKTNYEVIKKGE